LRRTLSPGVRFQFQRRKVESFVDYAENKLSKNACLGKESRDRMAAVRNRKIDEFRPLPEEIDMAPIQVERVVRNLR